ncbi:hypothetical protein ACWEFL_26310 [Streptomyces sp. NPDC004838]
MALYIGVPIGLIALLLVVAGVAALRWSWLPSWQRRHVVRPQLFGWAQLTIAAALVLQLAGGLLIEQTGARSAVTTFGAVVALFGLSLMVPAQRQPRRR